MTFPRTISSGFTGTPPDGWRPGQPAVRQRRPAVHRGLQAQERVAPRRPAQRRADLPRRVHQRAAVQHARHEVRPRRQRQPARPGGPTVRTYDPFTGVVDGAVDRTATPYASGTRATCRSWEAIRGNGCWWARWPPRERIPAGADRGSTSCSTVVVLVLARLASSAASLSIEPTKTGPVGASSRSGTATCWPPRPPRPRRSSTSATTAPSESIDKVAAGATGDFRKQYDTSTNGVLAGAQAEQSVMDGEVVWAGVVTSTRTARP